MALWTTPLFPAVLAWKLRILHARGMEMPIAEAYAAFASGFVVVVHMPMAPRTRTLPRHFPGDPSIGLARRAIPGACGLLLQRMMEAADVPRI